MENTKAGTIPAAGPMDPAKHYSMKKKGDGAWEPINPAAKQADPTTNDHVYIQALVMSDMIERQEAGIKKYGTALQPFNGRDALVDAYQEAMDLTMYLRQEIYERTGK